MLGDIDFRDDSEGEGLLVCIATVDNAGQTLTSPAEMDEHINDGAGAHTFALATETVFAGTGSMGPKRFTVGSSQDFIGMAFILKEGSGSGPASYTYPKILDKANRSFGTVSAGTQAIATLASGNAVFDDLLVLMLARDVGGGAGGTVVDTTSPASQGWTEIYNNAVANNQGVGIWWKRADTDDASTQPDQVLMDWTGDSAQDAIWAMYRFGGITYDTADSFIGFLGANSGTIDNPLVEPVVDVPFDNSLLMKVIVPNSGSAIQRRDFAARGAGSEIDFFHVGASGGATMIVLVEGVPFAAEKGGNTILASGAGTDYEWVDFYIAAIGA